MRHCFHTRSRSTPHLIERPGELYLVLLRDKGVTRRPHTSHVQEEIEHRLPRLLEAAGQGQVRLRARAPPLVAERMLFNQSLLTLRRLVHAHPRNTWFVQVPHTRELHRTLLP